MVCPPPPVDDCDLEPRLTLLLPKTIRHERRPAPRSGTYKGWNEDDDDGVFFGIFLYLIAQNSCAL